MSKKSKFFSKKTIDPKGQPITGITAVNILDDHLITGDDKGNLVTYEFSKSDTLIELKKYNCNQKKIEKIVVQNSKKYIFILTGGEVYYANMPLLNKIQPILKTKDTINIFVNNEDEKWKNHILVLNKKKKLKIYEINMAQDKVQGIEKKMVKDLVLDDYPNFGLWSSNNYFIFSLNEEKDGKLKGSNNWLNLDNGNLKFDDFPGVVEIKSLGEKVGVSNRNYTLFMKDGTSFSYSMLLHDTGDFNCYCEFKNHLFALYNQKVGIYKGGPQQYNSIETIDLDENEIGKFMVASESKLVVLSESNRNFHFINFKEKPIDEQIKVLIDLKEFDNAIEKLVENMKGEESQKREQLEKMFLDCAWACLEGDKKEYDKCIKYLSLTNFNPFEFIYMFVDSLNSNIIHEDKKTDILDRRKENQLFGLSAGEGEQKKAFEFLIEIMKIKRNYILGKYIKGDKSDNSDKSAEIEGKEINFMSSERSRINLSESNQKITIKDTFYAINSTLIKSMIKIKADPKEIELALDNETINNSNFDNFENEKFFSEDKNKDLDEVKFTLSYIQEKKGDNYEEPLKQWEAFGRSNNTKYSEIGRDRTKKIFLKFNENKDTDKVEKEKLFRKYILWLLEIYQDQAFDVVIKTELVTTDVFIEEIIPEFNKNRKDGKTEDLKQKFLEYCNENQKSKKYQTQLLQLYADKLFKLAGKENPPEKIEGEIKTYYDAFMKIIQSEDSVYEKTTILGYIDKSWLKEPRIYLYSQLKEHDKALQELFKGPNLTQCFKEIEEFCQKNLSSDPEIFQKFYKLLSEVVNKCQDDINKCAQKIQETKTNEPKFIEEKKNIEKQIKQYEEEIKKNEESKAPYEQEMLNILKRHGKIEELNPIKALEYANDYWNVCESNEFFDYLMDVVKEYTVSGNKYKITKNLSEIGLIYKEKEAYEYKKKYVTIDSEKTCDLCKKKIGTTIFVIYPNLRVYHSKCAQNANIDPMTGVDFSKKKYIE